MKIIASKITIPNETPRVCRRGLLDTLQENLESRHATVINGRSGTGKTMLAVDFVRRYMGRVAWYKVDAPDMSLPVFLEYLVASVARVLPGFGRQTLGCQAWTSGIGGSAGGSELDIAAMAEAYVYDLERYAEPLVLVIDDLHLIYDADWVVPFFHRLLLLIPAGTHILILGRGLPPAPMWRLRSKQRLFVITEQMLAFTRTEAVELFAGYGLSAEEAVLALKQTRGRAADLHAAAVLAANLSRAVTLVTANAGAGKTTLVADFVRAYAPRFVWYQLDHTDADPAVFLSYIAHGIRQFIPDFGQATLAYLRQSSAEVGQRPERAVDALINEALDQIEQPLVIVLDDYHHLGDAEAVHAAVDRLLAYQPDVLHTIIVSREAPPLQLAKLRSHGELAIIDRNDLLFTDEETQALFNQVFGLEVTAEQLAEFRERTQGWVI